MNAEQLLAHFDRIADSPDAIPRLRRFILDLAVRGKLVPQVPNDEPTSIPLKEGEHGNLRRVRRADISGWLVASVGSLLEFQYGKGMKASERLNEGPVPVFGSNGIVGYCETALTEMPSIIIGRKGSAGALNRCDGPSWTTDVAYFVEAPNYLDLRYLFIGLQTLDLESLGKGVKPGLSRSDVYELPLNIPPLAEQHRIVAKVDELMALCDRLEAARTEQEAARDRMATASLARLNAPDPDPTTFKNHATFALNNLTPLTTRPDQIKALRQTILNLAVRGKLVPQDPNDEPASELLKRIATHRVKLEKSGTMKKLKILLPIDAPPFSIPQAWEWIPLSEITHFENGDRSKNYPSGSDIKTTGVPFVNTKNISNYTVNFDQVDHITEEKFKSLRSGKIQDLDILITLRGSVGKLGLFQATEQFVTGFINAQLLIVRNFERSLVPFCLTFMKSQVFLYQIFAKSSGSATPQLSASQLADVLIPLPPRTEQHRIVAKVDELMTVCDRLEAILAAGEETQGRLVEATLHQALEPNEPC